MSNETGEASFNGAVATLQRHDFLLQKISAYALNKDYEMWLTTLKHLKREVSPYIKETALKNIQALFKKLRELEWIKIDEQGRRKIVEEECVEDILDEITILIQRAMFEANILMARKQQEADWD
jgi:hypothetical protein